jgi:hypothetical protein
MQQNLTFCTLEIEYLGYVLTRDGIKHQGNKVQAILMIKLPTGVKQLRHFLGMVHYYHDQRSEKVRVTSQLTPTLPFSNSANFGLLEKS